MSPRNYFWRTVKRRPELHDKNLKKALETGNKVKRTYKKKDGSITIVQPGAKIRQTKTESLVDLARKSICKDKIVKPKFRKDTKKLFTPEKFKATTGLSKKQAIDFYFIQKWWTKKINIYLLSSFLIIIIIFISHIISYQK